MTREMNFVLRKTLCVLHTHNHLRASLFASTMHTKCVCEQRTHVCLFQAIACLATTPSNRRKVFAFHKVVVHEDKIERTNVENEAVE